MSLIIRVASTAECYHAGVRKYRVCRRRRGVGGRGRGGTTMSADDDVIRRYGGVPLKPEDVTP
ncbi:MAG TPA: hypothetical protein PK636_07380, partial [bacterium]|nr:hypothetical protein [bacterium]